MTTWHASGAALQGWVDGTCGPVVGASVEQHVVHCAQCRAEVAVMVPGESLASGWEAVLATVEMPRPTLLERFLLRIGLPPADTVIIATAPRILVGWLTGLVCVLGFTFVARDVAGQDGMLVAFLLAAPLLPVVGVALAYGPGADPSYDAVLATPYRMFRLVLLRTAAVLVVALPLIAAVGLLLPIATTAAVAWLLPATGFVVVVLGVSSWVNPEYAAGAIAAGWVGAVAWAVRVGDPLAVVAPFAMLGYAALLTAGCVVLGGRLLSSSPSWRLH
jgi:hypothetical protein